MDIGHVLLLVVICALTLYVGYLRRIIALYGSMSGRERRYYTTRDDTT